jgi:RNA polymerase sigma-70 factor (ECF subfamily)
VTNSTDSGDAELVRLAKTGQKDAYKDLVARYQGHVYGLDYSLVGDWTDAQDIAQETFIRAYSNLDKLRDPERFAAWLRRVAFSVSMNWVKTFRPRIFEQLDGQIDLDRLEVPDFQPGPPEVVEKRDLANAVLRAVESLPPRYRVPLAMFHLDGLSHQKVAQFLDIPLGTAKSLIHRAREKLRPALGAYAAEELTPVVQEVFDEHKLPPEFARKVLEGIADLGYDKSGETTLCGSIVAVLEYMKDPVGYDFVMGVSGTSFKLLWHLGWCTSNNSMGILGSEPIRRAFRALGYDYEYIWRDDLPDAEEVFRRKIKDSIDNDRPVIACGIIGPPDEGIVAGYDRNGEVLLGRSYFCDGSQGYYEKADWFKDCYGLIVVGKKKKSPPRQQILRETLQWAVQLGRTPTSDELPTADGGRATGLAAYDAWAEALKKDEDFPSDDMKILTFRCQVSTSVTLSGLRDARKTAVSFLKAMAQEGNSARGDIQRAAAAYEEEVAVLEEALTLAPFCWQEEKLLQMADPKLRARLSEMVLLAKEKDEQAVTALEEALEAMS